MVCGRNESSGSKLGNMATAISAPWRRFKFLPPCLGITSTDQAASAYGDNRMAQVMASMQYALQGGYAGGWVKSQMVATLAFSRQYVHGRNPSLGRLIKIDHPLGPCEQISLSFIGRIADMMNIYNGNVTTDKARPYTVTMPDWFECIGTRSFVTRLTVTHSAQSHRDR